MGLSAPFNPIVWVLNFLRHRFLSLGKNCRRVRLSLLSFFFSSSTKPPRSGRHWFSNSNLTVTKSWHSRDYYGVERGPRGSTDPTKIDCWLNDKSEILISERGSSPESDRETDDCEQRQLGIGMVTHSECAARRVATILTAQVWTSSTPVRILHVDYKIIKKKQSWLSVA